MHRLPTERPLQLSIRLGQHQAAQVLRQLELQLARAQKAAATSERTQQAARQDTPEARKAAERNAAALIEEEERDEAAKAQSKVRGVELAPVRGVSDAVSLAHGWVARSKVPAAVFMWRLLAQCVVCSGGWGAAEGQGQGQGRWWRAVQQGGGCGEQQRRGEHFAWRGQPLQHAAISKRWPPHH